jgi:hypothetical protein
MIRLSPHDSRKLFAAQQLYKQGVRNIYTAPSHFFTLAFTWLIGGFFIGNAVRLVLEKYHVLRPGHGLSGIKKYAIEAGNRLTIIFFTVIGGYALLRYRGLIKSLDLVQVGNTVELRISVRRFLPILKPKEYVVPPYDLHLPRNWKLQSEQATIFDRGPAVGLLRLLLLPFRKFKEYLFMNNFVAANFETGQRKALLDTNEMLSGAMDNLEAISTTAQPWDS